MKREQSVSEGAREAMMRRKEEEEAREEERKKKRKGGRGLWSQTRTPSRSSVTRDALRS